jgi:UDP-glucose 4-epimerase
MAILVTGGAGFIGSHVCVELLERGHDVVVVDNFSNSSPLALAAVRELADGELVLFEADIRDQDAMDHVLTEHSIDVVVHLAGMKAISESLHLPLEYYDANISGALTLLQAMTRQGVSRLVFSSSCSIYGDQFTRPIREDDQKSPINPYSRSKLVCEQIMADACARFENLAVIALRYFNPAGAHPSGLLGEAPPGTPGNLMPHMMRVADGRLKRLQVFGSDHPTADGSPVRDFIHVLDVARAHGLAVERTSGSPGFRALNIGTGVGVSVLGLIATFEETCGVTVPYELAERRAGEASSAVADPSLVAAQWGWRTSLDIKDMCRDAWRFQRAHPLGYGSAIPAGPGRGPTVTGRRYQATSPASGDRRS